MIHTHRMFLEAGYTCSSHTSLQSNIQCYGLTMLKIVQPRKIKGKICRQNVQAWLQDKEKKTTQKGYDLT